MQTLVEEGTLFSEDKFRPDVDKLAKRSTCSMREYQQKLNLSQRKEKQP